MAIQHLPTPSGDGGNRARVAAEVRAALARVRIPVYKIADLIGGGTSRAYWSRRVNGETPFDIDDLSVIASITGTPITDLVRTTEVAPPPPLPRTGGGSGRRNIYFMETYRVGPAGIEPTTSTVESLRFAADPDAPLAPVTPITRNQDRTRGESETVTILQRRAPGA
jgi:hypothetical protein